MDSLEDEFDESLDLDGALDILDAGADEAPVIRVCKLNYISGGEKGASDIHIEPYEKEVFYRFRINGIMTEVLRQPKNTSRELAQELRLWRARYRGKRLPQDGRIKIKMAGKDIDIRLSTVPIQNGERIVMRVLEKSGKVLQLEQLGYGGKVLDQLDELSRRKHEFSMSVGYWLR